MEKFQIYLFTMPRQIKLVIKAMRKVPIIGASYNTYIIDEVNIDLPGEKMNSITSS